MGFDWKKLDRDQRASDARLTPVLGAGWLGAGLVVLLISLITGHLGDNLVFSVFSILLGGATLAVGVRLRRQKRGAGRPQGEPHSGGVSEPE